MKLPKPLPLYPTYNELVDMDLSLYPALDHFLNEAGEPTRLQHWQWGLSFLKYIGRNKSEHTYNRFRNETERFLTWIFLVVTKGNPSDKSKRIWYPKHF